MRAEKEIVGDVVVLTVLEARLDGPRGAELKQLIAKIVADGQRSIIVDLANVKAIDSTGLGALVSSLKIVTSQGYLALCGLDEPVSTLFRLTRMDRVFRSFPKRRDAIAAHALGA